MVTNSVIVTPIDKLRWAFNSRHGDLCRSFSAKVRFDQSGRNRLGESADLFQENNSIVSKTNQRPIWGSWFGVDVNLVVDENVMQDGEIINSMDYRFTYVPNDSIIKV